MFNVICNMFTYCFIVIDINFSMKGGHLVYLEQTEKKSHANAKVFCEEQGSKLFEPKTLQEFDTVFGEVDYPQDWFWIGIDDKAVEDK